MINNSYNNTHLTNKYNTNSSNSSNSNFLNKILIYDLEYNIKLSDISNFSNLCYIVKNQTNIYLPDIENYSKYHNITFIIINNTSDNIYIHSSNNSIIYSTLFNSISGDTSMHLGGNRIIKLISTMSNDKICWNVFIN
jgi:hypothetical protein